MKANCSNVDCNSPQGQATLEGNRVDGCVCDCALGYVGTDCGEVVSCTVDVCNGRGTPTADCTVDNIDCDCDSGYGAYDCSINSISFQELYVGDDDDARSGSGAGIVVVIVVILAVIALSVFGGRHLKAQGMDDGDEFDSPKISISVPATAETDLPDTDEQQSF